LDTIYYEINKKYKDKPFDLYILNEKLTYNICLNSTSLEAVVLI